MELTIIVRHVPDLAGAQYQLSYEDGTHVLTVTDESANPLAVMLRGLVTSLSEEGKA